MKNTFEEYVGEHRNEICNYIFHIGLTVGTVIISYAVGWSKGFANGYDACIAMEEVKKSIRNVLDGRD